MYSLVAHKVALVTKCLLFSLKVFFFVHLHHLFFSITSVFVYGVHRCHNTVYISEQTTAIMVQAASMNAYLLEVEKDIEN